MSKEQHELRGTPAIVRAWASLLLLGLAGCGTAEHPLQGYVEGEYLRVGAPFAGTLQQLSVRRGAEVKAGAPLFALERANETAVRREAEERLASAEARLANLQTGKRPAEVEVVAKQLQQARAAREVLAQADWRLAQRAFASPAAGLVHDTYYNPGDFVPAGSPVVSILPPGNVKARFYLPETELGRISPGAEVTLACDGCGAPIRAKVDFVSDKAEFTPPVLYSKENRAKLVFLVEARPAPADATRLKPGQPIDVTLPAAAH